MNSQEVEESIYVRFEESSHPTQDVDEDENNP